MAARPDAGWSWVIAFSCSYIHLALFGIFRSAGVIFVALLDAYDTTREEAAWPFSLCSAIFQVTAPIASVASRYFSVRKICLLGSFVATVGITCCFFADSILWIIIFYGIIHGLGFGLVAALVPVIVNQYFVRYRATGVGIAFSGGTVSTFVFPVAMEFLLHVYGLQGTFLILGGVVMNTLVASSMLRAPPWLEKKKNKEKLLDQYPPEKGAAKGDRRMSSDFHSCCEKPGVVEEQGLPFADDQRNLREDKNQQCCAQTASPLCREQVSLNLRDHSPDLCLKKTCTPEVPNSASLNGGAKDFGEDNCEDALLPEPKFPCNMLNGGHKSEPVKGTECSEAERDLNEDVNHKVSLQNEFCQTKNCPDILANHKCHANETSTECAALLSPQLDANGRNGVDSKYILKEPNLIGPSVPLTEVKNPVVVKKKDSSAFPKMPNKLDKQFSFIGEFIEVLCHPMFHVLTLSMCFFFLSVHTFFMVMVDFAMDKGIPESQAIYVLSVFSATDLLGRAGLGWVTDRNYIKRKNMVMINLGVIGVLNNFYPFASTVTSLFSIAAFHGLAVGSSITLFFVLQAEYLGMKKLPLVIGMTSFFNGVTTFLRPAMTGLFRDEIGSYDWMFHFLGILMLSISAMWLLEPWLRKRTKSFYDEDAMSSRFTDLRKSSC